MKNCDNLTLQQISLLLYLETRAVDHGGAVASPQMNAEDFAQANQWNQEGFIEFGRIRASDFDPRRGSHWIRLSDDAWDVAHQARKERADRMWPKRRWHKT